MQNNHTRAKKKNNTTRFQIFYFFGYAAMGVMNPLISQYLGDIGFSGTQIGTVTSVATAVAVFASAFWGKRYSNSRDGRRVIALICAAAAAMALANTTVTAFALFVVTYGIQYFFQGPVMGVADALVLECDQTNFSSVRLWGAVGYAVAVFIGGKAGDYMGLDKIFYIYAIAFLLAAAMVMTTENQKKDNVRASDTEDREKIGFRALLRDKRAVLLILCGIFVMGTNVANNTYFGFLFRDGGGTIAGVGTAFLLMVGSEAPCMALAPWFCKKFSQEKVILAAMVLSAVRFGIYATGPSYYFLLLTFFVQGMVNGVLLTEYVKYLSAVVEPRLIGIAIAAFYAVSSNGGTIVCNFFGGVAMDWLGSAGVYGLFSLLNIIGVLLYVAFGLHRHRNPSETLKGSFLRDGH